MVVSLKITAIFIIATMFFLGLYYVCKPSYYEGVGRVSSIRVESNSSYTFFVKPMSSNVTFEKTINKKTYDRIFKKTQKEAGHVIVKYTYKKGLCTLWRSRFMSFRVLEG